MEVIIERKQVHYFPGSWYRNRSNERRRPSSWMRRPVALVRTDVPEERIASIIKEKY
jgi:hypothetical protein